MSHHTSISVSLTDRATLVRALARVFGPECIEMHDVPAAISTFAHRDVAHLVVRRGAVCVENPSLMLRFGDLGFRFEKDRVIAVHDTMDAAVLHRIRQAYAVEAARDQAGREGWAILAETRDPDGSIRLVFAPQTPGAVDVVVTPGGIAGVGVTGVKGSECLHVTAGLQSALGDVISQTLSPEAWESGCVEAGETEAHQ